MAPLTGKKLHLERLIFAQAQREHISVWARRGKLIVKNASAPLRKQVRIYNLFFAEENQLFLAEHTIQEISEYRAEYAAFCREQQQKPLQQNFQLLLDKK